MDKFLLTYKQKPLIPEAFWYTIGLNVVYFGWIAFWALR